MKQITLNIPDDKIKSFMVLVEKFGLTANTDFTIPEEHKEIVRQRIKASKQNPERLLNWDDIKNDFILE